MRKVEKLWVYILSTRAGASTPRISSFPKVLKSIIPTPFRTIKASFSGVLYTCGRFHWFESIIFASKALCFMSRGVSLVGIFEWPAKIPRLTGSTGGREVVEPRSLMSLDVCLDAISTKVL